MTMLAGTPPSGPSPAARTVAAIGSLLMLLAFPLTITFALTLDRSPAVRAWLGPRVCPAGWSLRTGGNGRASRNAESIRPYCLSPDHADEQLCLSCVAIVFAPLAIGVAAFFVHAAATRPTAADHLTHLAKLQALGHMDRAVYEALRRQVIADPHMTHQRFMEIMRRHR